jgi:hypothetical protein
MADALVTPERNREIEDFTRKLIEGGSSLQTVINKLNERGDLSDNEWTATVFALGYFAAATGL